MNIQTYIAETWGAEILQLDQKTATVSVPTSSVLDGQAFSILLRHADTAQWKKAIKVDADDAQLIHRNADPIMAISSGPKRGVVFGGYWRAWQSKLRHEFHLLERPAGSEGGPEDDWTTIHEHWQLGGIDPQTSYPYLDFFALEDSASAWWDDEPADSETYELQNGDKVVGEDAGGEYIEFWFGVRLNTYGKKLAKDIKALIKLGLLEQAQLGGGTTGVSIAPWNHRSV